LYRSVDHRADRVVRVAHVADLERLGLLDDEVENLVVASRRRDEPRAGRALLALESVGRLDGARRGLLEIRVVVDDDRVLAAHLRDDALEPLLAGVDFRGALVVTRRRSRNAIQRVRSQSTGIADFAARGRDELGPSGPAALRIRKP
jgi:hypothetical protein